MRVLGFERFELGGHARGASHDHSRIIRRSYHTEHYVRLTAAAYDAWREVKRRPASSACGSPEGSTCSRAGAAIDATTYTAAMEAAGVPFDRVDGADVRRRWPAIEVATTSSACTRRRPASSRPIGRCRCCNDSPPSLGADLRGGCGCGSCARSTTEWS